MTELEYLHQEHRMWCEEHAQWLADTDRWNQEIVAALQQLEEASALWRQHQSDIRDHVRQIEGHGYRISGHEECLFEGVRDPLQGQLHEEAHELHRLERVRHSRLRDRHLAMMRQGDSFGALG